MPQRRTKASTSALLGINTAQLSQKWHICNGHLLTPPKEIALMFLTKLFKRECHFTFHAMHPAVFRSLHMVGSWPTTLRKKIPFHSSPRNGSKSMRMVGLRSNLFVQKLALIVFYIQMKSNLI